MVVTYPLITLSTRAQTESLRASKAAAESKDPAARKPVGTLEAAKAIVKREGLSGLYSGLESALFGISVTNFVYYYFYEGTKAVYQKRNPRLTTAQSMLAGAIAGSATSIITNPIWVVNTRLTVRDEGASSSTIQTIRDIIKNDGVGAFFSGIGPALVLVINPVLQYTIFEQLRNIIEKRRKMTPLDAFFIGALGKIIATSVTYPYITLKSRLQLRKKEGATGSSSLIKGIQDIVARDGVAGLYKGITAKVTQSAISSAFLFFFKEQLFAAALLVLAFLRSLRK